MVSIDCDANYDPWATIYNKSLGAKYCETLLPPVERLLERHFPVEGTQVLDLCCGTGQMVKHLCDRGYRVTGLDISEAMLNYARHNAPDAQFILDDARFFNLPATFHAVISPSGSLNHMMNLEELKSVFQNVYSALIEGGIFLLGLNLEQAYQYWNGSINEGDIQDDYAWASRDIYYPDKKIAEFQITIFHLWQETWQRSDLTYAVKAYSRAEIVSTLEAVGFTDIKVYDGEGSLAKADYDDYAIFACHK